MDMGRDDKDELGQGICAKGCKWNRCKEWWGWLEIVHGAVLVELEEGSLLLLLLLELLIHIAIRSAKAIAFQGPMSHHANIITIALGLLMRLVVMVVVLGKVGLGRIQGGGGEWPNGKVRWDVVECGFLPWEPATLVLLVLIPTTWTLHHGKLFIAVEE